MGIKEVEQIENWHLEREHNAIINYINALSADERSDQLKSLMARALINLNHFKEAVVVLDDVKEENRDGFFCMRYGLAHYLLKKEYEALEWFRAAKVQGLEEIDEFPGTFYPKSVQEWIRRAEIWAPRRKEKNDYDAHRHALRNKKYMENIGIDKSVMVDLWDDCDYSMDKYIGKKPSDEEIAQVEAKLGYRLPFAYKQLIKEHNGGMLMKNCFLNPMQNEWSSRIFCIESIYGIDPEKKYSLCGSLNTRFWVEEWGYPDVGIVICDTISGGHNMIFLDYRDCGPESEPCVVEIDQESDYEITYLADNFKEFIEGLYASDDET